MVNLIDKYPELQKIIDDKFGCYIHFWSNQLVQIDGDLTASDLRLIASIMEKENDLEVLG